MLLDLVCFLFIFDSQNLYVLRDICFIDISLFYRDLGLVGGIVGVRGLETFGTPESLFFRDWAAMWKIGISKK